MQKREELKQCHDVKWVMLGSRAAAKGYGKGMGHWIRAGGNRGEGLWGGKRKVGEVGPTCQMQIKELSRVGSEHFFSPKNHMHIWQTELFLLVFSKKSSQSYLNNTHWLTAGNVLSLHTVINLLSNRLEFHYPIPLFFCKLRSPGPRDWHRDGEEENNKELRGLEGEARQSVRGVRALPAAALSLLLAAITQWIPDVRMINKWIVITV